MLYGRVCVCVLIHTHELGENQKLSTITSNKSRQQALPFWNPMDIGGGCPHPPMIFVLENLYRRERSSNEGGTEEEEGDDDGHHLD